MQDLSDLALSHEDWLMKRVLQYAKDQGYVKYTSTLVEAWRTSIVGLSEALRQSVKSFNAAPDFGPDEDFKKDSIACFGILEAQRHRGRGITLTMFLGLMKYYRQSYVDLVMTKGPGGPSAERNKLYLERFFDRIELGFVTEWVQQSENELVMELQNANRLLIPLRFLRQNEMSLDYNAQHVPTLWTRFVICWMRIELLPSAPGNYRGHIIN